MRSLPLLIRTTNFKNTNNMSEKKFNYNTEKAMPYDALSCPVIGVVTPYFRLFEQWKRDIGFKIYGEDAKFIQLRRMEDVVGREYFTIEKGYKHYEIDSDIYDAAILRVR